VFKLHCSSGQLKPQSPEGTARYWGRFSARLRAFYPLNQSSTNAPLKYQVMQRVLDRVLAQRILMGNTALAEQW